jgi:phosphoethanolamine N-methyltransferase
MADTAESGYSEDETGRLELIWGEGFLSPGGPAEVERILGGHDVSASTVLDIGSGAGGADLTLVRRHGAGEVIGIDVQPELVELARDRAAAAGLADRITYRLVDPGPLPFADGTFDVVFSKDAIIHVRDKDALYAEAHRVLRRGGRLLVGDWFRGEGDALTPDVDSFVEAAEHGFVMASLAEVAGIVERIGFVDVGVADRRAWYLSEARSELERLRGGMRREFVERWGEEAAESEIRFWEVLVDRLTTGALSPGHIRGRKR